MGGYGSGRWGWHTPRQTVEDSLPLRMTRLHRNGYIVPDALRAGVLRWSRGAEPTAAAGFQSDLRDAGRPLATLDYRVTRAGEEPRQIKYRVELETTPCNFGGVRWWFRCPNVRCGRRCGVLYLPPGALYFACRECHELTYTSCRESHKWDCLFARLAADMGTSPEAVKRALKYRYGR